MSKKSYIERKKEIQDKHIYRLAELIFTIGDLFKNDMKLTLGLEYIELEKEYEELDKYQEIVKKEFFSESSYVEIKNSVKKYNEILKDSFLSNEDKEYNTKQLRLYLDKLSTLNVTLNNKLKATREKRSELKKRINEILDEHSEDVVELVNTAKKDVHDVLTDFLQNLKEDLNKLAKKYNIVEENPDEPFDFDALKITQITSKLESEFLNNKEEKKNIKVECSNMSDEELLNVLNNLDDDDYTEIELNDDKKIKS